MTENAQRNREAEVNLLAAAREAQWSAAAFGAEHDEAGVAGEGESAFWPLGRARTATTMPTPSCTRSRCMIRYTCAQKISRPMSWRSAPPKGRPARTLPWAARRTTCRMTIDLADRTGQDLAVPAADNLAFKAADRLSRAVGRDLPEAIQLRIESTSRPRAAWAAARRTRRRCSWASRRRGALRPMTSAWPTLPGRLGADVAFFPPRGCALLGGVGEVLQRRLETSRRSVVLVKPAEGVSTAEAYKRFDAAPRPRAPRRARLRPRRYSCR